MSDEQKISNTPVTIHFPTEQLAKLFLAWMSDGGGEQYFYDVAADDAGMYLNFDYGMDDPLACLVSISGRVVDDDDPEVQYGIYEDNVDDN